MSAVRRLLHTARGSGRGCLSAINQHELCTNRSRKVVFIEVALWCAEQRQMPSAYISGRCLRRFSGRIVERFGTSQILQKSYESVNIKPASAEGAQCERVSWGIFIERVGCASVESVLRLLCIG